MEGVLIKPPTPSADYGIGLEQLALTTRDHNFSVLEQYDGSRSRLQMESLVSASLRTQLICPPSAILLYKATQSLESFLAFNYSVKPKLKILLCKMSDSKELKSWGGRFEESVTDVVEKFTESISFDKALYKHDITASKAHASQGLISASDRDSILGGLDEIQIQIEAGEFMWRTDREDVHMNNEATLTDTIGEPAKKLHTARNRNDQVLTDFHLWCHDAIDTFVESNKRLQVALVKLDLKNEGRIIPAYTHLQRAQPVLLEHLLLAYVEQLERDADRLLDCGDRLNFCPLGACALAGTGLPIDRFMTSEALKFAASMRNSGYSFLRDPHSRGKEWDSLYLRVPFPRCIGLMDETYPERAGAKRLRPWASPLVFPERIKPVDERPEESQVSVVNEAPERASEVSYFLLSLSADEMLMCTDLSPEGGVGSVAYVYLFLVKCVRCQIIDSELVRVKRSTRTATKCPNCGGQGSLSVTPDMGTPLTIRDCQLFNASPLIYLNCKDVEPVYFSFRGGEWEIYSIVRGRQVTFELPEDTPMDVDPSSVVFSKWHTIDRTVNDQVVWSILGLRAIIERRNHAIR